MHEVLEKFFDLDIHSIGSEDYSYGFRSYATAHLLRAWSESRGKLQVLGLTQEQLTFYLIDSQNILNTFFTSFFPKIIKTT